MKATQGAGRDLDALKLDESKRIELSKRLSWVLRRGAKTSGLDIDDDGWVKVSDLPAADCLKGMSTVKLLKVVEESNQQKFRYELLDDPQRGQLVRAAGKKGRDEGEESSRPSRSSGGLQGGPERPERPPWQQQPGGPERPERPPWQQQPGSEQPGERPPWQQAAPPAAKGEGKGRQDRAGGTYPAALSSPTAAAVSPGALAPPPGVLLGPPSTRVSSSTGVAPTAPRGPLPVGAVPGTAGTAGPIRGAVPSPTAKAKAPLPTLPVQPGAPAKVVTSSPTAAIGPRLGALQPGAALTKAAALPTPGAALAKAAAVPTQGFAGGPKPNAQMLQAMQQVQAMQQMMAVHAISSQYQLQVRSQLQELMRLRMAQQMQEMNYMQQAMAMQEMEAWFNDQSWEGSPQDSVAAFDWASLDAGKEHLGIGNGLETDKAAVDPTTLSAEELEAKIGEVLQMAHERVSAEVAADPGAELAAAAGGSGSSTQARPERKGKAVAPQDPAELQAKIQEALKAAAERTAATSPTAEGASSSPAASAGSKMDEKSVQAKVAEVLAAARERTVAASPPRPRPAPKHVEPPKTSEDLQAKIAEALEKARERTGQGAKAI